MPLMHHRYSYLLGGDHVDDKLSMGVQTNIPLGSFTHSITEM